MTASEQIRAFSLRNAIRQRFGHHCDDLVSTADLLAQLEAFTISSQELQRVPLNRIVGSGRSQDFDLQFNPKRSDDSGLRLSMSAAAVPGEAIPPPILLKIHNTYLVVNGNHRISAARRNGWEEIEARVTELDVPDLVEKPACSRLGFKTT